jgi:hypothetical protein
MHVLCGSSVQVAVPLSKAGDCLAAVQKELYGPAARWRGFRSPALVRFIRGESAGCNTYSSSRTLQLYILGLSQQQQQQQQ